MHDLLQQDRFPGLDLYYTAPAQHLITAGWDLDDLPFTVDRHLSDVWNLLQNAFSTIAPFRNLDRGMRETRQPRQDARRGRTKTIFPTSLTIDYCSI